jgi:hypothetical protein
MAELADAADSKSADPCGHGGSTPPPGTNTKSAAEVNCWTSCVFPNATLFRRHCWCTCLRTEAPRQGVAHLAHRLLVLNFQLGIREVLLLKGQRRPADSLPLEVEGYVDMVGDLDERNTAVHPVVLTVEDHCPLNLS